jgi:hypothetical protein
MKAVIPVDDVALAPTVVIDSILLALGLNWLFDTRLVNPAVPWDLTMHEPPSTQPVSNNLGCFVAFPCTASQEAAEQAFPFVWSYAFVIHAQAGAVTIEPAPRVWDGAIV